MTTKAKTTEKATVPLKAKDKALLDELSKEMHEKPEAVLSKALLVLKRSLANDKLLEWADK